MARIRRVVFDDRFDFGGFRDLHDLPRGALLVAATYVLAGALFALSPLIHPVVDPAIALLVAVPLVACPPILLRDHLARIRLADPTFGDDVLLADD
ncbi:hypothetical protein ACFQE1_11070 [Halobium palmae]|uniref:Uncharacterized protein n=1 Tax=Halobium palmae TaxID=1776492 RepID=A0ABD5S0E1_9EURY